MSSTSYKLVYFNLRALGEPIRMLFKYMEVPFEDVRLDPAVWPSVKNDYKWRQVPELYVTHQDHPDKTVCLTQTAAICRYLANSYPKFELMPLDPLQIARCDIIVDVVQDMRIQIKPYIVAKYFPEYDPKNDPTKLPQLKKQILEDNFQLFLKNLNQILEENKGDGDFICGEKVKWADFFLANFITTWEQLLDEDANTSGQKLLEPYPALKKQYLAVEALPKIQAWMAKRPITNF